MHHFLRIPLLSVLLAAGSVHAADVDVGISISGEIQPGVYGRIELGNKPKPPVVYAEPVIIVRPPAHVRLEPVYMHVPPGHAKNWKKHCKRYDACGRPVYFIKSDEYRPKRMKPHEGRKHGEDHHDRDHGGHHDKGHGRGRD